MAAFKIVGASLGALKIVAASLEVRGAFKIVDVDILSEARS